MMRRRGRGERGFTLTELLIVMGLMALVLLITLPALGNFLRSNRVRSATNLLVNHIKLTRHAAIATATTESLTVAADGLSYTYPDTRGNELTYVLPEGVSIITNTPNPLPFRPNGSIDGTTSASFQVQGPVTGGEAHRYTVALNNVGKVTVTRSEVSL